MSVIVQVLAVLLVLGFIYSVVSPALNRRLKDSPPSVSGRGSGRPVEIESAEAYRNHLSMARWIELQLKDDLVRSSVPADEQAKAKRLLDDFYGDVADRP